MGVELLQVKRVEKYRSLERERFRSIA